MKTCQCSTEIIRDGSSQLGRYLKALDPSYVQIDGRNIEELLVFAKRYATQIRFYDIPESKINGTPPEKVSWKEFFRHDMAVIAASIASVDLLQIKKDYDETRSSLESDPETDIFAALFKPIIGMVVRIDHWYSVAIPGNPLRNDLELAVNSLLKLQMKKVMAYEEGFKFVSPKKPLKLDYTEIENDDFWGLNATVEPDSSIYEGAVLEDEILTASLYIDDIFNSFHGFLTQLVDKSEQYLQFALEEYPAHQPHMALFITFLQLFRLAQEQINGLTGKMLDFYYRDVLHLTEKPSVPDRVHIVFELAKGVAEYGITNGTELKAGKDALGKEQIYKTESDLVVNQAKVKELKTIFIEKTPMDGKEEDKIINGIYARPVANSLDGFGEKFEIPNSKWPTFGKGSPVVKTPKNICEAIDLLTDLSNRNDQAKIGFAIASPQLLLQGGKRLVEMQISGLDQLANRAKKLEEKGESLFEIWLTGEKEWLVVDQIMSEADKTALSKYLSFGIFNPETNRINSSYFINKETSSVSLYLPISEQAIVTFDAKLHPGYDFKTTQPVLLLKINPLISLTANEYHGLTITNLSIRVKVGSINPVRKNIPDDSLPPAGLTGYHFDGLKTMVLQNESGLIPPNKAFDPFTAFPGPGKSLYLGSPEVFNKPLGKLAVNILKTRDETKTNPDTTPPDGGEIILAAAKLPEYRVSVLAGRDWDQLSNERGRDFYQSDLVSNILNKTVYSGDQIKDGTPINLDRKPIIPVTEWTTQTEKGFLRINNLIPLPANTEIPIQASQNLAPVLEIKEISVSYESDLQKLENGIDQFFHLYPFGVVETYLENQTTNELKRSAQIKWEAATGSDEFSKLDKEKDGLLVNADNHLLPQFTYLSPYAKYQEDTTGMISTKKQASLKDNYSLRLYSSVNTNLKLEKEQLLKRLMLSQSGLLEKTDGQVNQYSNAIQEEGLLFIGLELARPLQTISLLFQFAEGSALDEDNDPPPIHWSYLTYNEWRPLKGENIISDGTFGFQTTGIVKLGIPADASNVNTIISNGLHWLCASVTDHADRIPQLIDVVTQAVEARFDDRNNAASHFDKVLAPASISKLAVAVAEVSSVKQPFASFDGKHREIGKEFYTRVSERLRHKGRAINAWDYEHLILDRFPGIYKVKCILHTDPNCLCRHPEDPKVSQTTTRPMMTKIEPGDLILSEIEKPTIGNKDEICCGSQVAPGHVMVVPIANLKNRNAANPLQPKTSRRTLLEIEAYLKNLTSPFVKIHARNPAYEQIIVAFRVQFYREYDKGYYMKKLNDEIVHYLTPWAFDEQAEVKFGQKVYASSIINFIEERPYVDFITDFLMGVCKDECCSSSLNSEKDTSVKGEPDGEGNPKDDIAKALADVCGCDDFEGLLRDNGDFSGEVVVKPSSPRSILVSVPRHIIIPYEAPVQPDPCEENRKTMNKPNHSLAAEGQPSGPVKKKTKK